MLLKLIEKAMKENSFERVVGSCNLLERAKFEKKIVQVERRKNYEVL